MNKSREHANMIVLINSFTTPDFNKGLQLVLDMPIGLNKEEMEKHVGGMEKIFPLLVTMESFGVLLHRGEITIDILDDFWGGFIGIIWQKIERYTLDMREETGRDTIGEWTQWLAEQMMHREKEKPAIGAHQLYKDWRPPT
jgi:hypothetical protein